MKKILSLCIALVLLLTPCLMVAEQTGVSGLKVESGISIDAENVKAIISTIPNMEIGEEANTIISMICDIINSLSAKTVIQGGNTCSSFSMRGNELLHLNTTNEDGKLSFTSNLIPKVALQLDLNNPKLLELFQSVINVFADIDMNDLISRLSKDLDTWVSGVEVTTNSGETEIDFLGKFENNITIKLNAENLADLFGIVIKAVEETKGVPELISFLGQSADSVFAQIRESLDEVRASDVTITADLWQESGAFRFTLNEKEEEVFSFAVATEDEDIGMFMKIKSGDQTAYMTLNALPDDDSIAISEEILVDAENKGYQATAETAGSRIITEDIVLSIKENGITEDKVIVLMESAKDVIHSVTNLVLGDDGANYTNEIFYSPEQKKVIEAWFDVKQTDETITPDTDITETIDVLTLTDTASLEKLMNALQNGVSGMMLRLIHSLPEEALALIMGSQQ